MSASVRASRAAAVDETFDVLSEFIKRLLSTAEADALDALTNSDISFPHFRTLMVLSSQRRELSLNELSAMLHLSLAATGRNVDKLVGLGLVDRREDTADRRVKRVSLTAEGRRIVTAHLDRKAGEVRSFLARLPEDLRHRLHDLLTEVVTGDYLSDPDPVYDQNATQKATS